MELLKKFKSRLLWGNLAAMLLVVILVCIGVWRGMAVYTHHGEGIEVPDLVGRMSGDVRYQLDRLGLVAVVVDSAYNKQRPAGCILEQLPAAGARVKSGREIYLTVNTSRTPTMAIPDIADNSSLREAEARLKAMGFRLGPVEYVAGDRDWVYGVKCHGRNVYAGDRVPVDALLVLQVGNSAGDDDDFGDEDEGEDTEPDGEVSADTSTDL